MICHGRFGVVCMGVILNDKEREYLSSVIQPFRHKVIGIVKRSYRIRKEYECIQIHSIYVANCAHYIPLLFFEKNTMYKGMQVDKEYSVGELEL